MTLKITAADAIAGLNAIVARIGNGAGPNPVLNIYDGVEPDYVTDSITTQKTLVTIALAATNAFGSGVDVIGEDYVESTAAPIADTPALEDGDAKWFRVFDKDGNARWQGSVTETGGGGDLEISSIKIIEGVNVVTVSLKVRMPKR